MTSKKNIIFTFDYELFLGVKSGSVDKCLIIPTDKLIKILGKHHVKAVFFVDTTYLIKLKEVSSSHARALLDYNAIAKQLRELVKKGHYVFPHIHPHWIDAEYDKVSNEWCLSDMSKYRFHNISSDEKEELFQKSIHILNNILKEQSQYYQLDGYRAGGWCIQPFVDFRPFFEKHGILHEFSVLSGQCNKTDAQYYDFREAPVNKVYRFTSDIVVPEENGKFIEYPISSIRVSKNDFFNRVLLKVLWKMNVRSIGDGRGVVPTINSENIDQPSENIEMVAIELLILTRLSSYLKLFKKSDYVHFISHPKMLSYHNIRCFKIFLKKVSKRYNIESDFKKM